MDTLSSTELITLIWVSLERYFCPTELEYRWCQFWSKVMTSEVKERSMLLTAGYSWYRSQWVKQHLGKLVLNITIHVGQYSILLRKFLHPCFNLEIFVFLAAIVVSMISQQIPIEGLRYVSLVCTSVQCHFYAVIPLVWTSGTYRYL